MNDTRAVLAGGWYLPPGSPYLGEIKDAYKLESPEWQQAMRLRSQGKRLPLPERWVYGAQLFPVWHPWYGGIMVPRAVSLDDLDLDITRRTVCGDADRLDIADHITLRDYQEQAVQELLNTGSGLVVAPCGAGKTTIGIGAISALPTRALVLVHTLDLAMQWVTRCKEQLNIDATVIGGGDNDDTGRVVVATIQSLIRWRWDELYQWSVDNEFGLCILDEAHHVPAHTFSRVLMAIPSTYRLGLTATPERNDGLTKLLYWHFGDVLKEISTKNMVDAGRVMAPRVEQLFTGWEPPATRVDWPILINKMCGDTDRNEKIIGRICELLNAGRQVLVLSDRVAHCVDLAEELADAGFSAAALVGTMSKKKRAAVLKAADSGELRAIFATTVADEGLDLPSLDTVVLTSPTKAMGRVQQRIGRIMRVAENKQTPLVVDCVDRSGALFALSKKRMKLYRELGCEV